MSFTSPFAFTLPIYALMSARVIRQCYALPTRQRQRKTAHNDAIHYVTNGPCGQPHFCEGLQCRRLPESPGHAPWGDARRLEGQDAPAPSTPARGCSTAGCPERGGRTPCVRRPTIEGRDAALQPLAAEEGVGVGLKPRRPDNAFIPHHAQMRKSIEEAQVTLGNRDLTRRALG